jgi:XTP/dITP diphosphohydrolase
MNTLILATGSAGKIQELSSLLAPIHCIPQKELHITEAEETGLSFIENAIIKARNASQCGYPALADDSGLVIEALGGQPGIYSARFSGVGASDAANIQKVLKQMQGLTNRRAYFYCVIALVRHPEDPTPVLAMGKLEGTIAEHQSGTQGFGYDPIFFLPEQRCTMAELEPAQKNKISHRAQALQSLFKLQILQL